MSREYGRARWAISLLGVAGLLALGAFAVWVWADASVAPASGRYRAQGISDEIRIERGTYGVPHISAKTQDDAYFALGFVHAQDRLWQMEWHRRLAMGRLAEIVGERGLPNDRLARLMGIGRLAEEGIGFLSPEVRHAFRAYAAGVNAWLAQGQTLPIEFGILRTRPEAWRDIDALAVWRGIAMQLSHNVRAELLLGRAAARLTPAELQVLFPNGIASLAMSPGDSESALALERTRLALQALPPAGASNVWAIAGRDTASGKPILANDPHTPFGEPALWYLAHLEAPGLDVTGATIPGFPFVLLGHNSKIAWGMTSNGFDVEDLFVEEVDPANSSRYRAPDGMRPFDVRHETIAVAGHQPEQLQVRETRHGPVLSDVGPRAAKLASEHTVVSLAYSGRIPNDVTAEALFRINHATNWSGFLDAARMWSVPPQNLVMAATDGTIGIASVGRVPIRKGADGRAPRAGASGAFDWNGIVPFEDLPVIVNPLSGRIVNANDQVAGAQSGPLGDALDEPLRAERIDALLAASGKHHVEDSMAIQRDVFASDAVVLLPLLLKAPPQDERSSRAMSLLRSWNKQMSADQAEPLIYAAWLRELTRALFAEKLGDSFDDYWQVRPRVVADVLTNRPELCPAQAGGCAELLSHGLSRALDDLSRRYGAAMERWRWGDAHVAELRHPILSEVPLLRSLAALTPPAGGGAFTINRGDFAFRNEDAPYASVFGAEFRAVYDLSDLSKSRFVISTGQSGHVLSRHRSDLMPLWRDGESIVIDAKAGNNPEDLTVITPDPNGSK